MKEYAFHFGKFYPLPAANCPLLWDGMLRFAWSKSTRKSWSNGLRFDLLRMVLNIPLYLITHNKTDRYWRYFFRTFCLDQKVLQKIKAEECSLRACERAPALRPGPTHLSTSIKYNFSINKHMNWRFRVNRQVYAHLLKPHSRECQSKLISSFKVVCQNFVVKSLRYAGDLLVAWRNCGFWAPRVWGKGFAPFQMEALLLDVEKTVS